MSSLTGNEVLTRVQRQFGDESGVQITSDDVARWIDDAIREIFFQNEDMRTQEIWLDLVKGQSRISVSNEAGAQESFAVLIDSVYYRELGTGDSYIQLQYLTPKAFNEAFPDWDNSNLNVPHVITAQGVPRYYTKIQYNHIALYPAPALDGVNALKVIMHPPALSIEGIMDDALSAYVPEHMHNFIVEFCLMRAYEMDEDWEAARIKGEIVQSTLDFNAGRSTWTDRQSYPVIQPHAEDNW